MRRSSESAPRSSRSSRPARTAHSGGLTSCSWRGRSFSLRTTTGQSATATHTSGSNRSESNGAQAARKTSSFPGRRRNATTMIPAPWKIKVVEPITLPSEADRRAALTAAGFNTFLLRSEDVFVDLLTDSGTSALSQEQRAAMEVGDEAYAGARSFFRLEGAMQEVYGFRHLIPTHQGRGAEHLLARILVEPGQLVPSNLYFTTSREHVELAGRIWVDVAVPEATDPGARAPFKGNIDLGALERVLESATKDGVAYVRQEACVNMAGGQPFSIDNL